MIIIKNFFINRIEKINSDKPAFVELNNYNKTFSLTYGEIVREAKKISEYFNQHNMQYSVAVVYLPASINLSIIILACLYSNITLIFKTISDEFDVNRFDYQFN